MMQRRPPWLDPQTPAEERGKGLSALVLGIDRSVCVGAMAMVSAGFTTYALLARGTSQSTDRPGHGHRCDVCLHLPSMFADLAEQMAQYQFWFTKPSGTLISL